MWTYDISDLQTSAKDQVRFIIGDTLATAPQLDDEEINFALTLRGSLYGAASVCCRSMAAKFSRSVDQAVGDIKASYSQLAKAYTRKAVELEALAATGLTPYAGGISVTDMINRQMNADRVPMQFNIGMMDALLPVPPVGTEQEEPSEIDPGRLT
jgi:hypothetical protein